MHMLIWAIADYIYPLDTFHLAQLKYVQKPDQNIEIYCFISAFTKCMFETLEVDYK